MLRSRFYLIPAFALVIGLLAVASPWRSVPVTRAASPRVVGITGVTPATGPAAGGNQVTISGAGFDPSTGHTSVDFGPNESTSVNCNVFGTQCTAIVPPAIGLAGATVDVKVTASGASATAFSAYTYNAPIITKVSPNSGPTVGGTQVTISGSNFTGVTQVTFAGIVSSFVVSATSPDTTIIATSPAHAAGGPFDIVVTTEPGNSSATGPTDQFTWVTNNPISRRAADERGIRTGGLNAGGAQL